MLCYQLSAMSELCFQSCVARLQILDALAKLSRLLLRLLGGLDRELVDDLDEPPQAQDDDQRRDLFRDVVLEQVDREADDDDEGVEDMQPA